MAIQDNFRSLLVVLDAALEHAPPATKDILLAAARANIQPLQQFIAATPVKPDVPSDIPQ